MAILSVLGLVVGVAVVAFGMGEPVCLYADWHVLAVVVLGGLAATSVSFPPAAMLNLARLLAIALYRRSTAPKSVLEQCVRLADLGRRGGILALENEETSEPFLSQGVRLAADGTEPDLIMDILETELAFMEERHKQAWRILETLGRNWVIFAAIGVALVLITGADDGLTGAQLARQAAYPALYGLLLAGLVSWPLARKLTELHHVEMLVKRMCIEAVMAIQSGDNPSVVEHKLSVFLAPGQRPRAREPQDAPPTPPPEPTPGEIVAAVEQLTAEQSAAVVDHIRELALGRTDEQQVADLAARAEAGELGTIPLLAALDQGLRTQVLERLRGVPQDPGAASAGRHELDFADFLTMPDATIQVFLRAVDQQDLVVGLKGASVEVREKFLSNMSQRVRAFVAEEIGFCEADPITILETQMRIVMQVRHMVEKGELKLSGRS